jgi:hypothetical protein
MDNIIYFIFSIFIFSFVFFLGRISAYKDVDEKDKKLNELIKGYEKLNESCEKLCKKYELSLKRITDNDLQLSFERLINE